jgi:hypothetical protein
MAERSTEVIRSLMKIGVMATINQPIDADTAELVANEFGHNVRRVSERAGWTAVAYIRAVKRLWPAERLAYIGQLR